MNELCLLDQESMSPAAITKCLYLACPCVDQPPPVSGSLPADDSAQLGQLHCFAMENSCLSKTCANTPQVSLQC